MGGTVLPAGMARLTMRLTSDGQVFRFSASFSGILEQQNRERESERESRQMEESAAGRSLEALRMKLPAEWRRIRASLQVVCRRRPAATPCRPLQVRPQISIR